tara:strand:+ start:795 stop:962 length:168 start_codon:yes stop_codon:yes gene_type:complete
MEANNRNFQFLRALECTAFFLLVLFAAFFVKTIMAVVNAFQSEVYTNVVAGLSSM